MFEMWIQMRIKAITRMLLLNNTWQLPGFPENMTFDFEIWSLPSDYGNFYPEKIGLPQDSTLRTSQGILVKAQINPKLTTRA